ncbi:hypothetical protein QE152_g11300 [Popillia japonica]|uniref:Uncharacterized protein n=1 Tax=Popillia japonica TaxID=7064 RepID=A0AAW1LSG6_POPJA
MDVSRMRTTQKTFQRASGRSYGLSAKCSNNPMNAYMNDSVNYQMRSCIDAMDRYGRFAIDAMDRYGRFAHVCAFKDCSTYLQTRSPAIKN